MVGAGRWLPDAALGLIVEEDMDEAFRSYHFARHALIALIGLGTLLIVALTYVDWRSRRSLARVAINATRPILRMVLRL